MVVHLERVMMEVLMQELDLVWAVAEEKAVLVFLHSLVEEQEIFEEVLVAVVSTFLPLLALEQWPQELR